MPILFGGALAIAITTIGIPIVMVGITWQLIIIIIPFILDLLLLPSKQKISIILYQANYQSISKQLMHVHLFIFESRLAKNDSESINQSISFEDETYFYV